MRLTRASAVKSSLAIGIISLFIAIIIKKVYLSLANIEEIWPKNSKNDRCS